MRLAQSIFDGYKLRSHNATLQFSFCFSVARHTPTVDTNNNMGAPAIWRVLLNAVDPLSIAPLHCTTVPLTVTVVVIVRVEVMSATGPLAILMRLVAFVKVATKVMLLHCGGVTPLQSTLLPTGVLSSTNRIGSPIDMNGSKIQSRVNPCVTVQV